MPAPGSAARQPVVIVAHGNGEVIDDWVDALDGFKARGIGVLLVEYPRLRSLRGDALGSLHTHGPGCRLRPDRGGPPRDRGRLFGFGQSLGGGAICLLAGDRPLRALILQSTFTSLDIFPAAYGAPAFLLRDHFRSIDTVARFQGPILVIHGRDDRLIPWQQGQRLAAANPRATFRLYDCAHGCWDPARLPFWQDTEALLRAAGLM